MQRTLKQTINFEGIGLHSGKIVKMSVYPAMADHGIVFVRSDITDKNNVIPAKYDHVVDTKLCTVIGNDAGAIVGTIEHLMAAFAGCGIDNALVEIDSPEVPVMDGSSSAFVEAFDDAGLEIQEKPRRAIRILKEVSIEKDGKRASLRPGNLSTFIGEIDFDHPSIGKQRYEVTLLNGNFRHDIAEARTFGFKHEVEMLRQMGLAQGGSLDNAIVLDETKVLNKDGLRFENEFIRHKVLDAIGDTALAGGPIIGTYEGEKLGHELTNLLLRELFKNDDAWTYEDSYIDAGNDTALSIVQNRAVKHLAMSS
jgi:UDP-3-O-[3-hydroxymyristoyl] N-acetylglucosamine deacetylase